MTAAELAARLGALDPHEAFALASEVLPPDMPQAVIGHKLFVLCDDGPACFEMRHDESNRPCLLPASMQSGADAAEQWQAAFPEVTDLDRLRQAEELAGRLPRTKLAALARTCLLALGGGAPATLARLEQTMREDPELG